MSNGDELLKEIKQRLSDKENPLDTETGLQFVLSLQIDRIENNKIKAAAQDSINDKVKTMWRERKITLGLLSVIFAGILGVVFDAITITINTGS